MKAQGPQPVWVKNKRIGGGRALICVPLSAQDEQELLGQAEKAAAESPDLIEWRADAFFAWPEMKKALAALRGRLGDIPLIFTLRHAAEGGARPMQQEERLRIITEIIATGQIELVDIELLNGPEFIAAVREAARQQGVRLILSYHDFTQTPPPEQLRAKLQEAAERGADIAKLAVMPRDNQDVLNLLQVTHDAAGEMLGIPLIAIAMGPLGIFTRIVGGQFGSAVTFAAGPAVTAPGQLPVARLREIISADPGDEQP